MSASRDEVLTAEQKTALEAELAELEGPRRAAAIEAIAHARAFGDLSENFEYHAAKNEQGLLEARIRTLRSRLDHAVIVDEATGDEVGIGSIVEVEDEQGETMTIEISAVGGSGTVSPTSPLGTVLLGRKVGETVDVPAPRGAWKATVRAVRPGS
jgi:transcription elongation factor GreA